MSGRTRLEFERDGKRYVWMTPGRTEWGHQITREVPVAEEAAMRGKGWRVYDPGWENGPGILLALIADGARRWWQRWRWVVAFVVGLLVGYGMGHPW